MCAPVLRGTPLLAVLLLGTLGLTAFTRVAQAQAPTATETAPSPPEPNPAATSAPNPAATSAPNPAVTSASEPSVPLPATSAEASAAPAPAPAPGVAADPELAQALELGLKTLREGALDLGLEVTSLGGSLGTDSAALDEQKLVRDAASGYSLWLQLERDAAGLSVRLSFVQPRYRTLWVRREITSADKLEVTVLRVLRDFEHAKASPAKPSAPCHATEANADEASEPEADGRAYLAVTGAMIGGYTGYALEHITGSSNPRVTYPLMTLGAGVGVAASLVAADEWSVSTGEAWYLSAATLWGTTSALLIHNGLVPSETSRRHAYGLLGTAVGLSLGTLAVGTSDIGQGDALVTQSGAIFGGLLGVLTERSIEPNLAEPPRLGLGLGIGAGALGAGFLVTQLPAPKPTRVVYVDLSAVLGALTGAATASPLIVGNKVTETETRIWLGSVFAGTLIGGALGYAITSGEIATGARAPRVLHAVARHWPTGLQPSVMPVQGSSYLEPGVRRGPTTLTWGIQGRW